MTTNRVQIKRSNIPDRVPTTLEDGELAINTHDGKLFYKDSAGDIKSFGANKNFAETTYYPQANTIINNTNISSFEKVDVGEFKFYFESNFSSNTYMAEINVNAFEDFGESPNFGIVAEKSNNYIVVKTGRTNIYDVNIVDRYDITEFKIKLYE